MLASELKEFNPDAIGLSVISLSIPEAIKTTQFLRTEFDVPILWGGVGVTLQPEIAIEHADLVCIGDGEEVIIEFADCLQNNSDWTTILGTWARTPDGEIIQNAKRPIPSLDTIAIPNWEPRSLRYITGSKVVKHKLAYQKLTEGEYQIMTQRGCPFSCSFCVESRYQEMFGKKNSLRRRSVDLVIDELVAAKESFDPRILWFWDDVFTVNPRWLNDFLPKYKEKVGIPFWCYTYPTTHNLQLLKDIKEAGCTTMTMGIQSGSKRILEDVYNRPTPLDRVIEAAQEIVDAGLIGYFDLISKSTFETEADLRATFEFLTDLPQAMNYIGHGEMKSYPTYSYTNKEDAAREGNIVTSIGTVDDKTYDYYHNLYWVARNPCIDKNEKLRIGSEPAFREQPELLIQYFYAYRTFNESLFLMRQSVETGEHPNRLRPPPDYIHKPLPQG
ncbi:MAG: B12-binding domain-containing radical SAM protein [Haliea sp.]|nr:B12-binding domain-containing radical SAM protein [Haliea sp.]